MRSETPFSNSTAMAAHVQDRRTAPQQAWAEASSPMNSPTTSSDDGSDYRVDYAADGNREDDRLFLHDKAPAGWPRAGTPVDKGSSWRAWSFGWRSSSARRVPVLPCHLDSTVVGGPARRRSRCARLCMTFILAILLVAVPASLYLRSVPDEPVVPVETLEKEWPHDAPQEWTPGHRPLFMDAAKAPPIELDDEPPAPSSFSAARDDPLSVAGAAALRSFPGAYTRATCGAFPSLLYDASRKAAAHWQGRLSEGLVNRTLDDCRVRNYECFGVQWIDGELYVQTALPAGFQSRTMSYFLQLWHTLKSGHEPLENFEFVHYTGDSTYGTDLPYWSGSQPIGQHSAFVVPEWSFFAFPEAGMPSYEFGARRSRVAGAATPWHKKRPEVLFRGAILGSARNDLERHMAGFADDPLLNIQRARHDNFIPGHDQCHWQHLLYVDGWAQSGRLKYQLQCRSVIIAHPTGFHEYFTPFLRNGTHWFVLPPPSVNETQWSVLPSFVRRVRAEYSSDRLVKMADHAALLAQWIFDPVVRTCVTLDTAWTYARAMTYRPTRVREGYRPLEELLTRHVWDALVEGQDKIEALERTIEEVQRERDALRAAMAEYDGFTEGMPALDVVA
ncbi:hypothetical protein AMAG_09909 [Allomyces macrogynus ATCC 38327]|uniref:Glycosyl transferase CAP10 domain-containing protein n=1 Tax=Allomyces macrogynus (strain ATCC 38327) TaxID=578462 RepID=A0A0L0SPU1_ALLM3|nr:hypothetical protein AMAG_09909 [Allomyces macrogynus ATCC 38327]|eukprot:KNE64548.1 hypothetical protein AMAG_09909 [Allomyces macrogynus ATCC 38327]